MENKKENQKEIRVRFAPSPTGELHIGGLRTALTDFLFVRKNRGKFILRIEDTDQKRIVPGAIERIIEMLEWAGIKIDEGVKFKNNKENTIWEVGDFGPYIQSERLKIYQEYVQKLLNEGKAYRCFCSPERLEKMRKTQQKRKEAPKYDRFCLRLTPKEIEEKIRKKEPYVIRFKIPEGKTSFEDLVYGKIEVNNDILDDPIILKSDGFPTYHLAMVVDDHLMKITHIFRGVEWLSSAPKHILLFEAFGWRATMPKLIHMPNILNKNRKKLSKREGSVSVLDFKNQGYPPAAIVNFIALLGWNPKTEQEIFTLDELIDQFDIQKMNRAGGVFDIDRLNWISAQHIKKMTINDLYENALPFLREKDFYKNWEKENKLENEEARKEYVKKVLKVERDRLEKFTQTGENNRFFFSDEINIIPDDLRWKNSSNEETKKNLSKAMETLNRLSEKEWELARIEKILLDVAGEKRGDLLFPLRAALTGQKKSPSPFEVAWVLGKDKTLSRIKNALSILE